MTQPTSTGQDWALGLTAFAAIFMMISGVVTAIQGIVALANSEFYVVGQEYTFEFDITAWGWILLLLGIVVLGLFPSLLTDVTQAPVNSLLGLFGA